MQILRFLGKLAHALHHHHTYERILEFVMRCVTCTDPRVESQLGLKMRYNVPCASVIFAFTMECRGLELRLSIDMSQLTSQCMPSHF